MAHLVGDIAKYFNFEEIETNNLVFKLFYQGCVVIFFTGSMVGVMSQYFGEPINCDFKGIDGEMASDYCWIHGSSYIPPQYQTHMKCIVDLNGVESADDAPDTSYYQWVTFVLLFQAGAFILPSKIWKLMEGGLMESFGTEGKSAVLLREEEKYEEGVIMEIVVEKYVKYFKSILHHNNPYFFKFVCCEVANTLILLFNFWFTDKFLQGRFRYYGWNVIEWNLMSAAEKKTAVNPFCAVFPTEVSCNVPNIGASGGGQTHNGLCVLSQNIINEKMYLVIWFWLVFLILVALPQLLYRQCTISFGCLRRARLLNRAGRSNDPEVAASIDFILTKCYIGDWFVLNQLSKNVSHYFFRAFVKELKQELRRRPKRSKSYKADTLPTKKVSTLEMNHIPAGIRHNPPPMNPNFDMNPSEAASLIEENGDSKITIEEER